MTDGERGNTTHGPRLDEEMERETRGMVQGHGSPHAEPFRETEPLPDDTDPAQTQEAFRRDDERAADDRRGADE
ncbi:hypothetical protein [Microbacterium timonense]|jgi:hypothetical protein|uniref:hypothetical protein n=1 Tax=Microbacterium timonense TaxID=2086576 RepID=UPI000D10462F|nr:hypothetical protein [Microbacterium timonense]